MDLKSPWVSTAIFTLVLMIFNCVHSNWSTWRSDDEVMAIYKFWLTEHGEVYNAVRFRIFKDQLKFIDEHNAAKNRTYRLGLNQFSHLTAEEFLSLYTCTDVDRSEARLGKGSSNRYAVIAGEELPPSVDWRKEGAVVHVKYQGQCGSCWAFSTIAAVEGINKIVTGKLISLSEQELVDCDSSNEGCTSGHTDTAFDFIVNNEGINSDEHCPYRAVAGTCDQSKKDTKVATIDGYEFLPQNDEKALQKAVANQPVSVTIVIEDEFMRYTSGILTGGCGYGAVHAVTVVGYGTENGVDYWLVKNSWGTHWGEQGYIRMQRNVAWPRSGICGIAANGIYPVKTSQNPPSHSVLMARLFE